MHHLHMNKTSGLYCKAGLERKPLILSTSKGTLYSRRRGYATLQIRLKLNLKVVLTLLVCLTIVLV